jgi:gamma-glutamylcyclotransferase
MNERELYFAYGSNMLTKRLCERVPSAVARGVAFLPGHLLTWDKPSDDGSGKCNIENTGDKNDRVYGVLFSLDRNDKVQLETWEGAGYSEMRVEVRSLGGPQQVFTYCAAASDPKLKPYRWYKSLVIAGAREHHLPEDYIQALDGIESQDDSDTTRALRALRLLPEIPPDRAFARPRPLDWLEKLGKARDGLLVLGGGLYVTGYGVWSYVAWRSHLGPLPVLEAQYIIAGIPLAVVACSVLLAIKLSELFLTWWPAFFKNLSFRRQMAIIAGSNALLLVGILFAYLLQRSPSPHQTYLILIGGTLSGIILYLSGVLIPVSLSCVRTRPSRARANRQTVTRLADYLDGYFRSQALAYILLLPAAAGLLFATFYLNDLYYRIPQSLGGAQPRCAQIDFSPREVSFQSRKALLAEADTLAETRKAQSAAAGPSEGVFRSRPLQVLFAASDILIVRVVGKPTTILEMDRKSIKAIRWCD